MVQLITPNLATQDGTGMCLRFVQTVYRNHNPYYYESAWIAWQATNHKRYGDLPTDVSVPVYFEHWGTYGSPARYANWGHIVAWVPGRGYLSSPAGGYGQQWFPTIEAVEQAFNAKYVGWALDVGGAKVAEPEGKPLLPDASTATAHKRKKNNMLMAYYAEAAGKGKGRWAVFGPSFWLELETQNAANAFAKQIGAAAFVTNAGGWAKFKRASQ